MNPKLIGRIVHYRGAPVQIRTEVQREFLRYGERVILKDTYVSCGRSMVLVTPEGKPKITTPVYVSEIKFG